MLEDVRLLTAPLAIVLIHRRTAVTASYVTRKVGDIVISPTLRSPAFGDAGTPGAAKLVDEYPKRIRALALLSDGSAKLSKTELACR